eukprot:18913-Heterococcus_DN1.PRE.3
MAELGDLLTGGGGTTAKPREVEIDMLDYGYIDKCEDPQQLRAILHRLNSGKDGHYPDLIKHAEARLLEVLPVKERVRLLGMKAEPSHAEIDAADSGLRDWQASIKEIDTTLKQQAAAPVQLPVKQRAPPPRATVTTAPHAQIQGGGRSNVLSGLPSSTAKKQQQQQQQQQESKKDASSNRLSGYDFKAWDKYDTDAAIQEIDDTEEQASQRTAGSRAARDADDKYLSEKERLKGNECFKSNEIDQAYIHYTKSIAFGYIGMQKHTAVTAAADIASYKELIAVAYCNRALSGLKLDKLQQAEDDCCKSLQLNPSVTKAWVRCGMVRHKRGKYALAIHDFRHALSLEQSDTTTAATAANANAIQALLDKSMSKYEEVEGKAYRENTNDNSGTAVNSATTTNTQ